LKKQPSARTELCAIGQIRGRFDVLPALKMKWLVVAVLLSQK
jgi:hypothetical protein